MTAATRAPRLRLQPGRRIWNWSATGRPA